jgi:hypothetical protein
MLFKIFCFILVSISLFTALFSPENEKSRLHLARRTRGKIHLYSQIYSDANLDMTGHHGNQAHIILATLSNASHALSSCVCQMISSSKRLFQIYNSLCHHDTVRQIIGKVSSNALRSRRLANIWAWI